MRFSEAFEALKQGAKVKCPEWAGFWKWEDNSIKMYCKDGRVLDIRETEDVDYTMRFILRNDWEIVEGEVKDLDIQTFTFGEAIRRLKAGQKVARKGWNGKGMFIYLTSGSKVPAVSMKPETANHLFGEKLLECDETVTINPHIDMKASDGTVVIGWLASQADMLATDWIVAE